MNLYRIYFSKLNGKNIEEYKSSKHQRHADEAIKSYY